MSDAQAQDFLHVDLGNIITWGVVAVAWLINRSMDWRALKDRIGWMEEWRKGHDIESEKRDELIRKLELATEKLSALARFAEIRLEKMEQGRRGLPNRWDKE